MSKIWRLLNIDSLSIDANFGLMYYERGNIEVSKPMLMKGVQFCDIIQKGNFALKNMINLSYLEAYEDIQVLIKHNTPEEFEKIVSRAIEIKIDLLKMIYVNATFSEEEIKEMQNFFIDIGRFYLGEAYRFINIRKLE